MNELVRRWEAVSAALERGDEGACLDAVRDWIEEWDRRFWDGDFSGFEQIYAPEFVGRSRVPIISTSDIEGPEGFAKVREEMAEATSRFWFDVHEVRLGPHGRFAGLGRLRARGRYSGMVLQAPFGVVWRVRDGVVVEATAYLGTRRTVLRELGPVGTA